MRKAAKRTLVGAGIVLVLALLATGGAALWVRARVSASLPVLDGERSVTGLIGPVTVERDGRGVPRVIARDRVDLARATGWLHAQDRFFQMDLLRRRAAGELSELFGEVALDADRSARLHGFRSRAAQALQATDDRSARLLAAYSDGVNAGLAALGAPPPEYVLSRASPAPWLPEDSFLVVLAMALQLQEGAWRGESDRAVMDESLPAALVRFLTPAGTEWDAPLIGPSLATPAVPGPEQMVGLGRPAAPTSAGARDLSLARGSNAWAVAGSHTGHGGALLANDMHLGLRLPNTWYRMSLQVAGARGGGRRLTGVTLPGTPALVTGSNGDVAWGFTNSYGDWFDLIVLESPAESPDLYLTPDGPRRFELRQERIRIRDGNDVVLEVAQTIWGPVLDSDHRGRRRALRWVVHDPEATNLNLLALERARSVEEALAIAAETGIPAQNFLVADRDGTIGWTVAGKIPRRPGGARSRPVRGSEAVPWERWHSPEEYPRQVAPPSGRIWSANNRALDGAGLALVGDGGFALGARARQIRDGLLRLDAATEEQMLALQLDDRAVLLGRWRDLLLRTLTPDAVAADPRRGELRAVAERSWDGRASVDSAGYRLVRDFRSGLARQIIDALTAPCRRVDPGFDYFRVTRQWEGPLWRLVTERPRHLLRGDLASWEGQLLAAADAVIDRARADDGPGLAGWTWGRRNRVALRHPLSRAVPALGRWLDIPARALPGDSHMPRVQGVGFGASQRMVVSPGREEEGIYHMPGGQSGHPFSPYYRSDHEAWADGAATPFLPGPTKHRLTLRPAGE